MFRFKCATCDEWHEGMPSFGAHEPASYHAVPQAEREARCRLESEICVVDDKYFFVRGCLEIPVHGADEPFVWGVWVSLSEANFDQFLDTFEVSKRAHIGPFFGWLNTNLPLYPRTASLATNVHLRDDGTRPRIELQQPSEHPLAVEQRDGMTVARLGEIYAHCMRR